MLDLQSTSDPHRFTLPVTAGVCVGPRDSMFLFGGAGLGAAIAALERATGRPAVWATAQYLSFVRPPAALDLDVSVLVSGRHSSQARVTAHAGGTAILTVNAALGSRLDERNYQAPAMPSFAPADACPPMIYDWPRAPDDVNSRFEQRIAAGRFGAARAGPPSPDGRSALWVRATQAGVTVDRIVLALMADFLPAGLGSAMGLAVGGNSLDNTIRYGRIVPTEWVLCDIHIEAAHDGFAHGRMRLLAEDGTLLASASQSMIVRG